MCLHTWIISNSFFPKRTVHEDPSHFITLLIQLIRKENSLNFFISDPEIIYLQTKVFKHGTYKPSQIKVKSSSELTSPSIYYFEGPTQRNTFQLQLAIFPSKSYQKNHIFTGTRKISEQFLNAFPSQMIPSPQRH